MGHLCISFSPCHLHFLCHFLWLEHVCVSSGQSQQGRKSIMQPYCWCSQHHHRLIEKKLSSMANILFHLDILFTVHLASECRHFTAPVTFNFVIPHPFDFRSLKKKTHFLSFLYLDITFVATAVTAETIKDGKKFMWCGHLCSSVCVTFSDRTFFPHIRQVILY